MSTPSNNALLATAMSQLGTKEIIGDEHSREVLKFYDDIGHAWVDDDETPWCAAFLNWCCLMALVPMVAEVGQRLRARGFLDWGETVNDPFAAMQGDVVVLWRGKPDSDFGHVGLLIGFSGDGKKVYLLGGNQSNQVKVSAYDSKRIIGIRRNYHSTEIVFSPKSNL